MASKLLSSLRRHTRRNANALRHFAKDSYGGVMAYVGLSLPVLLGVSGLAVDVSTWYVQKRSAQAIADAAALATVREMQRTGDETLSETAAKKNAVIDGLDEPAGDIITFNSPPLSGAYAGTTGYYEVIVERPALLFFASLFADDFNVEARAVSGLAGNGTPPCITATDPSMKDAFKVNNGIVNSSGCTIQVNSDHSSAALHVANNGSIEADVINVKGGYDNKGTITPNLPNTNQPVIQDALASLSQPTVGDCDHEELVEFDSGIHTLEPGVYCGGISIHGDADVTMEEGTYVITGGVGNSLSVTGQASVTGDGVTTYFDGDTNLSINGQGAIDLTAPSDGHYQGVLFYTDPYSDPAIQHLVTGNGDTTFDGVMYFPNAIAKINGNGYYNTNANNSAVLGRELRFGGNGTLDFHINDVAALPPRLQYLTLVE